MDRWRALSSDPWALDRHVFLVILAALALSLVAPAAARAQLVGTATLESEYRLRGLALSNGEPDIRLGVTYDHASGFYAGALAIVGEPDHQGVRALGHVANVGFATQTVAGVGWDIGVTTSQIALYLPVEQPIRLSQDVVSQQRYNKRYTYKYNEIYAGVSVRDVSARLYFSNDYLGQGARAAYLDLTAAVKPAQQLRFYGHVGALTPLGGSSGPNSSREYFDVSAGAVREFRHGEVQLAWTTTTRVEYPVGYRQNRSALTLSVTGFF